MTISITFAPGLKPVFKHLTGQHDQKTHGRWASSGLPHELTNYDEGFQGLRDAGILQNATLNKWGDVVIRKKETKTRYFYDNQEIPEGWTKVGDFGRYEKIEEVEVDNSMDKPFSSFATSRVKREILDKNFGGLPKELEASLNEIEKRYIGADEKNVRQYYSKIAQEAGMTGRNGDYFVDAMTMRAEIFITNHNEQVRYDAMKAMTPYIDRDETKAMMTSYFKNFEKTTKTVTANLEKAFPVVAIESDDFMKVIADGRFKTQYETRESNGAYKPYLRRTRELAFLGVPQDTKASERPIYGFLAVQVDGTTPNTSGYNRDKWNVGNTSVSQYGEVRVVLNDGVRERTSYTIPDSLDGYALARPLSEKHTYESVSFAGIHHDLTTSHGGLQREGYAEAQVYGGIKLSDIKEIYVVPSDYGSKSVNSSTVSSIKSALEAKGVNIPVKALVPEKSGS